MTPSGLKPASFRLVTHCVNELYHHEVLIIIEAFTVRVMAIELWYSVYYPARGTLLVVQLVGALRYKPDGRGLNSRWCHLPHYDPRVDSASKRNEYQIYFRGGKACRCVGLITLPLSCADCLEIWEPQPPGTLRACPGL
jgi:hypothetical protein